MDQTENGKLDVFGIFAEIHEHSPLLTILCPGTKIMEVFLL
jgi:hypothetical protein